MGKKDVKQGSDFDAGLTQLFSSSFGPVHSNGQHTPRSRINDDVPREDRSSFGLTEQVEQSSTASDADANELEDAPPARQSRKRKRSANANGDLESQYFHRLAVEEAREQQSERPIQAKSQKSTGSPAPEDEGEEGSEYEIPQHETVSGQGKQADDLEKSSRTVFLSNVSTSAITSKTSQKELLGHLTSFRPSTSENTDQYRVESIRFRSTAFAETALPKKASFVTKGLMEATTKATNAYAVYTTQAAAREACQKLNGTVILDRHLRVDSVAHPAKQDHRRCVFVGNLGFVDQEAPKDDTKDSKKAPKRKAPADAEEGLWRQFSKAGQVENVRVIRDKVSRVGKGFAYVQFYDGVAVDKAIAMDGQKYPPLLPRPLRVTRAKNPKNLASKSGREGDKKWQKPPIRLFRVSEGDDDARSAGGRAGKLLGRAGAAELRDSSNAQPRSKSKKMSSSSKKRAEAFKKKRRAAAS